MNLSNGISDKSSAVSIICTRIKFQIYETSVTANETQLCHTAKWPLPGNSKWMQFTRACKIYWMKCNICHFLLYFHTIARAHTFNAHATCNWYLRSITFPKTVQANRMDGAGHAERRTCLVRNRERMQIRKSVKIFFSHASRINSVRDSFPLFIAWQKRKICVFFFIGFLFSRSFCFSNALTKTMHK